MTLGPHEVEPGHYVSECKKPSGKLRILLTGLDPCHCLHPEPSVAEGIVLLRCCGATCDLITTKTADQWVQMVERYVWTGLA